MRYLKFLGGFLSSIFIALSLMSVNVSAATTEPTKEDYEYFYSCISNTGITIPKASLNRFIGKTFYFDLSQTMNVNIMWQTLTLKVRATIYNDNVVTWTRVTENGSAISTVMKPYNRIELKFDSDLLSNGFYQDYILATKSGTGAANTQFGLRLPLASQPQYDLLVNSVVDPPVVDPPVVDPPVVDPPVVDPPVVDPPVVEPPPELDQGDGSFGDIFKGISAIVGDFFSTLVKYGLLIIAAAIGVGVIFQLGKWLWRKLRSWLIYFGLY